MIEKIALITFGVYWVLVEVLKKKGVLERYSITSYGPILMIRTQKGMEALERLSRPKSFWRGFSSVGLVFMLFAMTLMLFLVFLMDYRVITSPPEPSPLTAPRNVLLLPGVNQFIPLWYGLIGLVITLIAHEFSHGVLCRVEGIKVRALGLLVALVPIGGFAEPDEEELNSAEKWKKIRVFTAGIMSNFLVALIFFAIFFSSLSFLAPVSSSEIVVYDAPQDLGIRGNMFLEEINGKRVMNIEELIEVLSEVKGGEEVNVKLVDREGEIEISTLLSSEGAKIMRVWDGTPAEKAGLKDGDVIISMNGERINNFADFYTFMKGSSPGEEVRIKLSDGREVVTVLEKHPKKDIGFLGVSVEMSVGPLKISTFSPSSLLKTLKSLPFSLNSLEGWFTLISLPFLAIGGFTSILTSYFLPSGIFSSHEILFFFILNSSFWIAWINFYAGLFNSLPAVPLDGGHVFKELLSSLFNSLGISNAKDLSSKFSSLITLYIFASFLLAILIPHISQWF